MPFWLVAPIPLPDFEQTRQGKVVIANGSRSALESIRKAYSCVWVVHVTANADILRERLRQQGRESDKLITQRLARHAAMTDLSTDCFEIDNNGKLSHAIDLMITLAHDALDEPFYARISPVKQ